MSPPLVVVAYCHLRWDYVRQRPQHLLSRLARHVRVFFVEPPRHGDGAPRLDESEPLPGLTLLTPRTALRDVGAFADAQHALVAPLVSARLHREAIDGDRSVGLLTTPLALPLALSWPSRCLVYDCMDEAAAPADMRQRLLEQALLERAALVITAGPSLYAAHRKRHANVHCVPSSVDAAHFDASTLDAADPEHAAALALQGTLPRPRLGYFGVIDERVDMELLAALADRHAGWQIVLVGPVARIDRAALPRRANMHWLGMQPYARLPHLLDGWDLALLPYRINQATRYVSPTKTLEYLAGGKPVVSTPIDDVVLLHGSVVTVARDTSAFVAACERLLAERADVRCRRQIEMLVTVALQSWDRSAADVLRLIEAAWRDARPPRPATAPSAAPALQPALPRLRAAPAGAR
jgi:UDP-galactopyranose mutase